MNLAVRIAVLGSTVLVSACTVIETQGIERATMIRPGVLRLEVEPGADLIAIESAGIGVVPSITGTTLGFRRDRVAILPAGETCKVVLFRWPDDAETTRQLKTLLADNEICTVDRGMP